MPTISEPSDNDRRTMPATPAASGRIVREEVPGIIVDRPAASGDVEAACAHLNVQSWADPSGIPTLWACDDCHRRFYPACPECVAVGHRNVVHEAAIRAESDDALNAVRDAANGAYDRGVLAGRAESAGALDVERLARAMNNTPGRLMRDYAWRVAREYARLADPTP